MGIADERKGATKEERMGESNIPHALFFFLVVLLAMGKCR